MLKLIDKNNYIIWVTKTNSSIPFQNEDYNTFCVYMLMQLLAGPPVLYGAKINNPIIYFNDPDASAYVSSCYSLVILVLKDNVCKIDRIRPEDSSEILSRLCFITYKESVDIKNENNTLKKKNEILEDQIKVAEDCVEAVTGKITNK